MAKVTDDELHTQMRYADDNLQQLNIRICKLAQQLEAVQLEAASTKHNLNLLRIEDLKRRRS